MNPGFAIPLEAAPGLAHFGHMSSQQKGQLIAELEAALAPLPEVLKLRQLQQILSANSDCGTRVTAALGLALDDVIGVAA